MIKLENQNKADLNDSSNYFSSEYLIAIVGIVASIGLINLYIVKKVKV